MDGSRDPAPGALTLVQEFVNTADLELRTDAIDSETGLAAWLAERSLLEPSATVTLNEVARTCEVREAIRDLLSSRDGPVDVREATTILTEAATRARLQVRFTSGSEAKLEPDAEGVSAAIGRILAVVYSAMSDGSWTRLKVCRAEDCRWAFYDHSKNRSGQWCSMAVCGNRTKTRTYRRRRAVGA